MQSADAQHARLGSRLEEGSFEFAGVDAGPMSVQPLPSVAEAEESFHLRLHEEVSDDGFLPVPPLSPTHAATAALSVSGPGMADFQGSISRVSATSAFSRMRDEFAATSMGFHASLADTAELQPLPNKSMRLTSVSQMSAGTMPRHTGTN